MSKWTKDNRKKPVGSKCEAKTRSGRPCKSYAMPNGRCRMHGGIVKPWKNKNQFKPGNKAALIHGLYSAELTEEEIELLPYIKVGTLDDEIKMLKLLLRRYFIADKKLIKEEESPYAKEILHMEKRLKQLKLKRKKLVKEVERRQKK